MQVPQRGNPLWTGREYPDLAQSMEILDAVQVTSRGPEVRYWRRLHIDHIEDTWFVINSSHCIFEARSEAEAAAFVSGLLQATERILNVQTGGQADYGQVIENMRS